MENLLVGRISRSTNLKLSLVPALPESSPDILYMPYHDIGTLAVQIGVLSTTDGADVRGYTGIDNDVLLACIAIDVHATKNEETVTKMQLTGKTAQLSMQCRKRERLLRYVAKREVKS
jgi:hypothetical protein